MPQLDAPLTLPCGQTLSNRIAKAAMSEHLAEADHTPGPLLQRLYQRWAQGGAALLLTGNVMIDRVSLENDRNVVLDDESPLKPFVELARATHLGAPSGQPVRIWVQLNHPGRQVPRAINPEPVAPSGGVAVDLLRNVKAFGEPRELRAAEIDALIERFAQAAALAQRAGFDGAQFHGAHGYLISQFLSPRVNLRRDQWGGSLENRARFALRVIARARELVGSAWALGIKLNSADFQHGGFSHEESCEVVAMLESAGIDLVELSGGSYESQAMFDRRADSPRQEREAYFLEHARHVREKSRAPLMVTGGFRSRRLMAKALAEGALDVVGLARPLAVEPDLPLRLITAGTDRARHTVRSFGLWKLDAVSEGGYCQYQMRRMGSGHEPDADASVWRAAGVNLKDQIADRVRQARAARS